MKIVAPAGNLERFYSAVNAGADEIYMGIKGFGARRNAENFTLEEYKEAIDYAHKRGSRIFLTLNTLMKNVEIDFLYTNLKALYEYGLDSIIVQDLGYFRFIKENFPDIDIHGSTQMTVANHFEAEYLRKLGFKRVVLPREMTFEEIKKIRENTSIELEVFVSGALCISYSGNCYMSSFIGGRSGNRGMCAQPCRKLYTKDSKCNFLLSPKDQLMGKEEIQKLKSIGINSIKIEGRMKEKTYVNEAVTYFSNFLLSPKDQLMGKEEIQKLKSIGINSIKIEGRMKEKTYVNEAVTYFKDMIADIDRDEKLSNVFNRGYSKGYFYLDTKSSDIMNRNYSATMGKNIGIISGKELVLEDGIILGDGITYLSRDYEVLGGEYINRIEKKNQSKFSDIMNRNYCPTMGKNIGIIRGNELVLEDGIILGDGITYLSRDYEVLGGEYINRIEKKNQREKFKEANVGDKIILRNAPKGAKYVFKNFDKEVIDEITQRLKQENKKQEIELIFEGKLGEKPVLKGKITNNYGKEIVETIAG